MGFFGRGVEFGTKEAMVAVGALRSCGLLGLAAAEALIVRSTITGIRIARRCVG
jgi:hypothetical protein